MRDVMPPVFSKLENPPTYYNEAKAKEVSDDLNFDGDNWTFIPAPLCAGSRIWIVKMFNKKGELLGLL